MTDETALLLMSVWGCGFIKMPMRNWLMRLKLLIATLSDGQIRYMWSTVSTPEFSRQTMLSCICWDWCLWTSLLYRPVGFTWANCDRLSLPQLQQASFQLAWLQLVRLILVIIFRYLDPWSSFTTCHHNCDPLSLLGPTGPFCYLWSTFASTSTLVGKFSSLHDRSWWDWCSW